MPVIDQETYYSYIGDGNITTFPFLCRVLKNTDLPVKVDSTVKSYGSDYTITGIGAENGGTVVFTSPPALGAIVEIERVMTVDRETDYLTGGDFRAEVVDADLDRLAMICQQLKTWVLRCFRAPVGEEVETIDAVEYANRAGKVLGYNSLGKLALMAMNYVTSTGLFANPWADVRGYAGLSGAVAALGGTSLELVIPDLQPVAADLTIPGNLHPTVKPGGMITVEGGKTLTMPVPTAGRYQIFNGAGTVVLTGAGDIYPEWWGADPTTSSCDADAIIRAGNSLDKTAGGVVKFSAGHYKVKTKSVVILDCNNIAFIGAGKGLTFIDDDAQQLPVDVFFTDYPGGYLNDTGLFGIRPTSYQTQLSGLTVKGISFIRTCPKLLTGGVSSDTAGHVFTWQNYNNLHIEGCEFVGGYGEMVYSSGNGEGKHFRIINNTFSGGGGQYSCFNPNRPDSEDVVFSGNNIHDTGMGPLIQGTSIIVTNNTLSRIQYGIYVGERNFDITHTSQGAIISNNVVDGLGYGITDLSQCIGIFLQSSGQVYDDQSEDAPVQITNNTITNSYVGNDNTVIGINSRSVSAVIHGNEIIGVKKNQAGAGHFTGISIGVPHQGDPDFATNSGVYPVDPAQIQTEQYNVSITNNRVFKLRGTDQTTVEAAVVINPHGSSVARLAHNELRGTSALNMRDPAVWATAPGLEGLPSTVYVHEDVVEGSVILYGTLTEHYNNDGAWNGRAITGSNKGFIYSDGYQIEPFTLANDTTPDVYDAEYVISGLNLSYTDFVTTRNVYGRKLVVLVYNAAGCTFVHGTLRMKDNIDWAAPQFSLIVFERVPAMNEWMETFRRVGR